MKVIKQNWKRYLISSGVSFLAGFVIAVGAALESVNVESLTKAVLIGVLVAGVRGGVKALAEMLATINYKKLLPKRKGKKK